ncbi:unnamed protein product [Cylicocyclus nassatus]|uniref:Uncharacterized protein n=1 Tax=Cylicocyclus nassatus TaxID=53992 RepID=A0AA36M8K0_CYLNA|nr:unnamed protein product [Cylicocyclus nassatus]
MRERENGEKALFRKPSKLNADEHWQSQRSRVSPFGSTPPHALCLFQIITFSSWTLLTKNRGNNKETFRCEETSRHCTCWINFKKSNGEKLFIENNLKSSLMQMIDPLEHPRSSLEQKSRIFLSRWRSGCYIHQLQLQNSSHQDRNTF